MFGPKAIVFAADNLHGPDIDNLRLGRNKTVMFLNSITKPESCCRILQKVERKGKRDQADSLYAYGR